MESCFVHCVFDKAETVTKVTIKQWDTSSKYANMWLQVPTCAMIDVAENRAQIVEYSDKLVVHPSCYSKFTNKTLMDRERKRASIQDENEVITPKRLRSDAVMRTPSQVLPKVCIICEKAERYTRSQYKTAKVSLSKAETLTAGELFESAKRKQDTRLLGILQTGDCVALEARYHRDCFKNYTRKESSTAPRRNLELETYTTAYKRFCVDVIDRRLVKQGHIYKLSTLARMFAKLIRAQEEPTLNTYRADLLKRRLQRDYPDLIIQSTGSKRSGMVVYNSTAIRGNDEEDSDLPETDSDSDSDFSEQVTFSTPTTTKSETHMTTLRLRTAVTEHNHKLPWPLIGQHITSQSCIDSVPCELVDFLKSIVSSSVAENSDFCVSLEENRKIVSICQDIMNLSCKKLCTPKGLALGLTIKHLTGSREVITLLHRLGHSASYDSILAYETSLAEHETSQTVSIPRGFTSGSLVTLVWDNIDFLEETKTGAGTTHHTNGILMQIRHQTAEPYHPVAAKPRGKARVITPADTIIPPLPHHIRAGPTHLTNVSVPEAQELSSCNVLEFALSLARHQEAFAVPSWTGFNKIIRRDTSAAGSCLSYLPVIESPPTDLDTVNHILQKSIDMADKFDLDALVVVFDQAIYSKAQQIRFLNPILLNRLVPRMGEFHTVMTFLGVIGKRFADAGLQDLLIESQIVAEGSMKGVISGHSYNRSIRANKLLFEVLFSILLDRFVDSLPTERAQLLEDMCIDLGASTGNVERFDSICSREEFGSLHSEFCTFITDNCRKQPTFRFWWSYLEMMRLCLSFIRATRESDWQLHLQCLRHMIPWFFVYDRHNYARYASLYLCDMLCLQDTHPSVAKSFEECRGSFTYQSGHHRPFTSIACDQAIEQTVNRHSKSQGGIIGLTLNRAAAQRWTTAQPQRSSIHEATRDIAGMSSEMFDGHELSQKSWLADDEMRMQLKDVIACRVDPFGVVSDELICITSGNVAPHEIQTDLDEASSKGEERFIEFVAKRIKTHEVDFFAPIRACKSKTLSNLKVGSKKAKTSVKCSKRLFDRLLIVSQQRNVDLKKVLSFSLGEVSWCLATTDGYTMKTTKSTYMVEIEKELGDCQLLSVQDVKPCQLIIDAMAELQSLKKLPATFGELAQQVLRQLLAMSVAYGATRVDFVCDTYPQISIKGIERARRAASGQQQVSVYGPNQKLPLKFKAFLSEGSNKESLVRFLLSQWRSSSMEEKLDLYVGLDKECHHLVFGEHQVTSQLVDELACDHEEADTRMLFHAKHAASSLLDASVVIKCQDTDVFVLSLAMAHLFPQLVYSTGRSEKARLIDMTAASKKLTPDFCSALLGGHALSGCDSTSSFYGKGKKKIFNLIKENSQLHRSLQAIGSSFTISSSTLQEIEALVCLLYGSKETNINDVRYRVFCSPAKVSEMSLPPTRDELHLHTKRACYQAAIWRSCLKSMISAPSPVEHGWRIRENRLDIQWMAQAPAPKEVLQVMFCRCKTGCKGKCGCKSAGLSCTDMCMCSECKNDKSADSDISDDAASDLDV